MRLLISIFLFRSTPVVSGALVVLVVGVDPGDGVSCEVGGDGVAFVVAIVGFAESNRDVADLGELTEID